MTNQFLESHSLLLTPLSPLHIGSGESYLPTNYVMHNGVVCFFDLLEALTDEKLKQELLEKVSQKPDDDTLRDIYKFLEKHSRSMSQKASRKVVVSPEARQKYDGHTTALYAHECMSFQGGITPYVPGSAIKGALRTVMLDSLATAPNQSFSMTMSKALKGDINFETAKKEFAGIISQYEEDALGRQSKDIMRLVKVADFRPVQNRSIGTEFVSVSRVATQLCEAIQYGQHRILHSTVTLQKGVLALMGQDKKNMEWLPSFELGKRFNLQHLFIEVNKYYLSLFESELRKHERKLNQNWVVEVKALLDKLQPALKKGEVLLMRLGKYTGAESKTVRNMTAVQDLQAKKFVKEPKTRGFVDISKTSSGVVYQGGYLPLGWVLVEVAPTEVNEPIYQWCASRNAVEYREKQESQLRMKEEEQARLEALKKEQEEAKYIGLSKEDRFVERWLDRLGGMDVSKQEIVKKVFEELIEDLKGLGDEFSVEEQKNIATRLSANALDRKKTGFLNDKRKKELKAVTNPLRGL